MIEVITRERSPEMAQRYQGTFGFLKTEAGKKLLVNILNVDTRYVEVQDCKGNNYTLASDTGCELEFTQVPSQWFQPDPDHIAYVTRRAERQYKRGICQGNTTIYTPHPTGTILNVIDTTPDRIEALFNPGVENKAFSKVNKLACGLWSKFFAWAVNTVYVKDLNVGTVDHEKKEITLATSLFQQEMRDALTRSNSAYIVKVSESA